MSVMSSLVASILRVDPQERCWYVSEFMEEGLRFSAVELIENELVGSNLTDKKSSVSNPSSHMGPAVLK